MKPVATALFVMAALSSDLARSAERVEMCRYIPDSQKRLQCYDDAAAKKDDRAVKLSVVRSDGDELRGLRVQVSGVMHIIGDMITLADHDMDLSFLIIGQTEFRASSVVG